jgi:uncharacterized protein (DUF2225 family)
MYLLIGEKSDDNKSPVYVPTDFSFTSSKKKRHVRKRLAKWKATQKKLFKIEGTESRKDKRGSGETRSTRGGTGGDYAGGSRHTDST